MLKAFWRAKPLREHEKCTDILLAFIMLHGESVLWLSFTFTKLQKTQASVAWSLFENTDKFRTLIHSSQLTRGTTWCLLLLPIQYFARTATANTTKRVFFSTCKSSFYLRLIMGTADQYMFLTLDPINKFSMSPIKRKRLAEKTDR